MSEDEREEELIFAKTAFPKKNEMFVPVLTGRFCSKGKSYSLMVCRRRNDVNEDE